jgi:type IV pilus assembly protein PilX
MKNHTHFNSTTMHKSQRGAVLIFALVALVVLLVGAVAMVRSLNISLFTSGNYGFKRDLVNQSERAMAAAFAVFDTGGSLEDPTARQNHQASKNYSATILAANKQGIPEALIDDSKFDAVGKSSNDIVVADQSVTVRYVVDRLCINPGVADETQCTMAGETLTGVSASEQINARYTTVGGAGASALQPVYRISIRVSGPRGTQSFFQSTFAI